MNSNEHIRHAGDGGETLPKTGPDQSVWWYDQSRKRRGGKTFQGHVSYISGAEGDRLRGELAAVIRDLLDWAAQQHPDRSSEDGEAA